MRDCTIRIAKTKALISYAVTAQLICVFVFAYAKSRFSHNEAHIFSIQNLRDQSLFRIQDMKAEIIIKLRLYSVKYPAEVDINKLWRA